MKIQDWIDPKNQMCRLYRNSWSVARLFELARDLPVMDVPLDHLCVYYTYDKLTLRDMAMHMKAVQAADMDKPIILDEDGELMDGRHRIIRAMVDGLNTIKTVRFDVNPSPCRVDDDE